MDSEVESGAIKTYIVNRFAMFSLMKTSLVRSNVKKSFIRQNINEDSIKYFKSIFIQNPVPFFG